MFLPNTAALSSPSLMRFQNLPSIFSTKQAAPAGRLIKRIALLASATLLALLLLRTPLVAQNPARAIMDAMIQHMGTFIFAIHERQSLPQSPVPLPPS